MIAQHAAMARALGEQLELPDDVLDALGAAYEMWDGQGLARRARGRRDPARRADRAAGRVRRGRPPRRRRRRRRGRSPGSGGGKQFDPPSATSCDADAELLLAGLDTVGTWDAVIAAEPALAVMLAGERFDAALLRDRELRRPQVAVHARPRAGRRRARRARPRRSTGCREPRSRTLRRAGLVHDLGRLGISNAIWDKRGPLGAGEWERVRLHPYLTERMLRQSRGARPARRDRRAAPRAARRLGLPARALRRGDLPAARILGAADAYQAMREPRPYRPALLGRRRGRRAAGRGHGRAARRRGGRGRARRGRPSRPAAPRRARRAHARARSRCSGCSRAASRTRRSPSGS